MTRLRLRHGVHEPLEAAADEILHRHLASITKFSEKSDVLTPWKEKDRRSREVYVPSGTPDAAHRQGTFHRAWNPTRSDLNSREGVVHTGRNHLGSMQAHYDLYGSHVEENDQ